MPEHLQEVVIPINKRQAYISALPCFVNFSEKETQELANLMQEFRYQLGEPIVEQDALVDSIYIIMQGHAEVTREYLKKRRLSKKPQFIKTPVAVLHPGEAIGLNDTGFYSSSGKRTATVTALTEMVLLKLDLEHLYQFFSIHPHLKTEMVSATENMLKMRLIKQSLPFSRLSHERLLKLINQIEEITVEPGTIIFNQGEVGDRCYLISTGAVEIVAQEAEQTQHQLAVLHSPTLFGEATLITKTPRNATAKALEACKLLVLRHEYLTELLESEQNVANMFMTLMVDRSRPIKNPKISIHHRTTEDEQDIVILKNPDHSHYFKLSTEGWFIWQQLDGKKTIQEITMDLADKFNIFAPDMVVALISKLAKGGFIQDVEVRESAKASDQPRWIQGMLRLRRILESRVAIGDADKWLTPFYNQFAYLIFTRLGKILLTLIAVSGMVAFCLATPRVFHLFKTVHSTFFLLILLSPFTILSVALHELGHALTTKYFGFEVHYMGVGWYWLGPVAFTDTSDMWLGTRWPRIFVNLAGIFTDTLTAGISALLIFLIPSTYVQCFLWIFALFTYMNAFRMLSPLQDLDGYYVLMDLFEQPKLRRSSVVWLVKGLPQALRNPRLFRNNLPEVSYWIACIVFLLCVSLLTILMQGFIFKILNLHASSPLFSLIIPFFVVVISSLGIIADIRNQAEE